MALGRNRFILRRPNKTHYFLCGISTICGVLFLVQSSTDRSFSSRESRHAARTAQDLPTISVCIPVIREDLLVGGGARFNSTLKSIARQTLKPREVILGVSEVGPKEADYFRDRFQRTLELDGRLSKINLLVTSISGKGSVGMNRNRAADLASSDVLSFFDADGDIMHHQRLEIIANVFQTFPGSQIVVHGFTAGNGELSDVDLTKVQIMGPSELCDENNIRRRDTMFISRKKINHWTFGTNRKYLRTWLHPLIHHGHLSITRTVFHVKRFSEDFGGKEDSSYVSAIVEEDNCASAIRAVFVKGELTTNYFARSIKENSKPCHEKS